MRVPLLLLSLTVLSNCLYIPAAFDSAEPASPPMAPPTTPPRLSGRAPESNPNPAPSQPSDTTDFRSFLPTHLQPLLRPADRPDGPIGSENTNPDNDSNNDDSTDKLATGPIRYVRPNPVGGVRLSDIIGKTSEISIFGSFTRDVSSVFTLLDGQLPDPDARFTVVAPVNKAISSLPRRPWQSEADEEEFGTTAYDGPEGQSRADANLESFVQRYVLSSRAGDGDWAEGQSRSSMLDQDVWYEVEDGVRYIMPGKLRVKSIDKKATNGELWIVEGTFPES